MKVKDRVTLYVTTNASGTDFIPLRIIGKSASPRCFDGHDLKLTYYRQITTVFSNTEYMYVTLS